MAVELRSAKKSIFLIGNVKHQITGTKLPSNGQVLAVLFYNIREVKLSINESANLTIRECSVFWEKARIPTKSFPNSVKKLVNLYQTWKGLQKNANKILEVFKVREQEFVDNLNNLFDIAHADALTTMKIKEDIMFLQSQREPNRPGHLAGVDKKLTAKEERARCRAISEENRRIKLASASCSVAPYEAQQMHSSSSDTDMDPEDNFQAIVENKNIDTTKVTVKKDFLTPKLVSALDRCQLSMRDSVYILEAAIEAFGYNADDFTISKSSMQRIRTKKRKERADNIKKDFQNEVPDVVTVHWDGKLLPALNANKTKEERLPVVITYDKKEQLLAVPKLEHSTGKEQAQAVWQAIMDWNLEEKVQIFCCDTTASNTGRINGACVLLEQMLQRNILLFACRHHILELVLKSVFQAKISNITASPDNPIFKNFKDNWKGIDSLQIQCYRNTVESYFTVTEIEALISFYRTHLTKEMCRDDYRELTELAIIFLGGDNHKKYKIRPPGAMHHARWMARAIYCLKICLFSAQLKMTSKEKTSFVEICLFIVTTYIKPWLQCGFAVKAPYQDLCFLKSLKAYEKIDKSISQAALKKFNQHLWYLTEEVAVLSLFDDDVSEELKIKIVGNMQKECLSTPEIRYIPSQEDLFQKDIADFISIRSKDLFARLKLNDDFLQENPALWANNDSFLQAQKRVYSLKAVNDTAERSVKLMQDFQGLITVDEEQKQCLLLCIQEHRKFYPDCNKQTLKRKYTI